MTAIIKRRKDEDSVQGEQSLAVSTPRETGQGLKKAKTTEGSIPKRKEMGPPSEARVKDKAKKPARRAIGKSRTIKKKRRTTSSAGEGEENRVRLGWGEAETMVSSPGSSCSHSRLKEEM